MVKQRDPGHAGYGTLLPSRHQALDDADGRDGLGAGVLSRGAAVGLGGVEATLGRNGVAIGNTVLSRGSTADDTVGDSRGWPS